MTMRIDLLGLALEVEVDAEPVAEHVQNLLRGFPEPRQQNVTQELRVTAPLGRAGYALVDGDEVVAAGLSAPLAVRALFWHLNRLALRTLRHTVLHAGAVATEGRTAVLPASMESGKSTLVAALVREGFEYLSDELAPLAVEDEIRLWPYRCPLGLDPGSFRLFPELRPSLAVELQDDGHWFVPVPKAAQRADEGVSPAAIIFPRYQRGAGCRLTSIGPQRALALAAGETLNLFELRRTAYATLCRLVRSTPAFTLTFEQLDDACAAVGDVLAAPA